ncbi:MAG: dihydropteroate synthase, partial [Lachnospiraceae bacterium]|nr:dihydropteroate synthase [Lachnospiraceae bacterium]
MEDIVKCGARIIGGCCGTTPDHIRALKLHTEKLIKDNIVTKRSPRKPVNSEDSALDGISDREQVPANEKAPEGDCPEIRYYLSGERKTVSFTLKDPLLIIGERINPTGKKKLQAELREGQFDMVRDLAEDQEEKGADILDVNMGMSGADEMELMRRAIEELSISSNLPLCLDTSHVDIMEMALRRYPGRALMNSVSLESEKCLPLLNLAKKYGAMFIILPVSDKGIPETLTEKKQIIRQVIDKALALGLRKTDIVVDGLVGTVGANPRAALETLETIRFCKEELGVATVCGLSNISFGMPERIHLNSIFLAMAVEAGITMAIANPGQEELITAGKSADVLSAKEGADIRYIEYIEELKTRHEAAGPVIQTFPAAASGAGQETANMVPSKSSIAPQAAGNSNSADEDSASSNSSNKDSNSSGMDIAS